MKELIKELKRLIKTREEVFILGHKNCDVDSFLSGILLERYLRHLGITTTFIIKDKKLDDVTIKLLSQCGYNPYDYMYDIDLKNKNVILVDHNKPFFECNVLGCIDHHLAGEDNEYNFSFIEQLGSCCSLIHNLIEVLNIHFHKYNLERRELLEVILSILIDTNGLRSNKCTTSDLYKIEKLKVELNISTKKINEMIYNITIFTDLNKPTSVIALNGYKEYFINDLTIKSSYIELNGSCEDVINNCVNYLETLKFDFWVFLVIDYKTLTTKVIYINNGNIVIRDYDKILSRGSFIIPKLEKILLNTKDIKEIDLSHL